MIKLTRASVPAFLDDEKVRELTKEFIDSRKSVWNIPEIKEPLLKSSYGKCAYCECDLREESKYMEVEHFRDKDSHPSLVVTWSNLLPACKRCNGSKSTHDVVSEPIVDPFIDNPNEHLKLRWFRMVAKGDVGETTIDVVDLNNYDRVVYKRFEIGNQIAESLEVVWSSCEAYAISPTVRSRNKIIKAMRALLSECQCDAAYSATASTVLHENELYARIKTFLAGQSLWDADLARLDASSSALVLL